VNDFVKGSCQLLRCLLKGVYPPLAGGIRPPYSDWVTVSLLLTEETEPHLVHSPQFMILNLSETNVLNPRAYRKLAVAAVFRVSSDQNHIE